MNRLLRVIFACLAGLVAGFAALFANYQQFYHLSAAGNKTVWACLIVAVFLAIAAWRFSVQTLAKMFALLLSLLLVEGFLQVAAGLGVLPGVNTKLKVSYGRVYWTGEGRGNSVRNRYGWYCPDFNLASPKKIAVIGDSFVDAVEVGRTKKEAAVLETLLQAKSPDYSVIAMGNHGTGPAHYLLVTDYAIRHFAPQEEIVIIYLGNDVSDCSPAFALGSRSGYIYYDIDAAGQLTQTPESAVLSAQFMQSMEACHEPLWAQSPAILKSHCMILQTALSIRDNILRKRQQKARASQTPATGEMVGIGGLGLNPRPFAITPDADVRHAMDIMFAELTAIQQKCASNHVTLHLVTVPFFPQQFYTSQSGTNWSSRIGDYDLLARDHELADFAHSNTIPFLSFADWLSARGTDVKQIQKLYFFDGSGHFTETGHQLCGQAMYETFYSAAKP